MKVESRTSRKGSWGRSQALIPLREGNPNFAKCPPPLISTNGVVPSCATTVVLYLILAEMRTRTWNDGGAGGGVFCLWGLHPGGSS